MSIVDEVRNQCDCLDTPGECLMCRAADKLDQLSEIADRAEIFACAWSKARQFLAKLPGTRMRGDDLYNAVFSDRNRWKKPEKD